MTMAWMISKLSHDKQTKHGCVITNRQHKILGCGYNGFPPGLDDEALLNSGYGERPDKYDWMRHSERNAVDNCTIKFDDMVAYVTGQCCVDCAMHMWSNGVKTVYMLDRTSNMLDAKQARLFKEFVGSTKFKHPKGLEVITVRPDLSFLLPICQELQQLGFIHTEREHHEKLLTFMKD